MLRSVLVCLLSAIVPIASLTAQVTPLRISITGMNDAAFRVVSSTDSSSRPLIGRGRLEMTTDSATAGSSAVVAVVAQDSLSRIHVEASEGGRVVATGEGAFVTIRRVAGVVTLESRSRAPASLDAATLRKLDAAILRKP